MNAHPIRVSGDGPRSTLAELLMLALAGRGEPTDPIAVGDELQRRGEFVRVGGGPYLHTLAAQTPVGGTTTYHAGIVADLARRRRALTAVTAARQQLEQPTVNTEQALLGAWDSLDRAVTDLPTTGPPPPTSWRPAALDAVMKGEHLDPPPTMLHRTDQVALFYAGAIHTVASLSSPSATVKNAAPE